MIPKGAPVSDIVVTGEGWRLPPGRGRIGERGLQEKREEKVMEAVFATHNGCIRNTAVVKTAPRAGAQGHPVHHEAASASSGLGGQIGELTAALNVIGWNHHQVPAAERIPASEAIQPSATAGASSGLGGQIGELAAALNIVGWNHHQVPPEERTPLQERT